MLRLLVAGRPNREIASALGIDEATVKAHVGRLMRKVGVDEPDCADDAGCEPKSLYVAISHVNRSLVTTLLT